MEDRVVQAENLLLNELTRTQTILDKKIATVQKNVDGLLEYNRITRMEKDNTTILLQMISDLKKEVDLIKETMD